MKLHSGRTLIITLLAFGTLSSALAADSQHRPFSEMNGDCKNFSTPLQPEFTLWNNKATNLNATDNIAKNEPVLTANSKTSIKLYPQDQVTLATAPEKIFINHSATYAGLVALKVPTDGIYRISAGEKVWFDLINANTRKRVESTQFEMQTRCNKIFKTVTFALQADKTYYLQISSSPKVRVDLLLSIDNSQEAADRPV